MKNIRFFLSAVVLVLVVKFSIYLNRCVFVMHSAFDAPKEEEMINKYSRLSLSGSSRDSLKYLEISVPRHIRFAEMRKK